MDTLHRIRMLGYDVRFHNGQVHLTYVESGIPDAARVRHLVADLCERKAEALRYLMAESDIKGAATIEQDEVTPLLSGPSPALVAAMQHPAYRLDVPVGQQVDQVESLWAQVAFAGLGRSDPGATDNG